MTSNLGSNELGSNNNIVIMGVHECVLYIRDNFEKKYADNIANGMYDSRDLTRLHTDDTFVHTYMLSEDRLDESVDLVHTSLKFRKEMKVNDLSESTFDRELLSMGSAYFHNRDINGHRILWLRVKVHRKDASAEQLAAEKQGLIFAIEKAFNESPLHGIVVLFDMTSCGLANLDMDFVKYIITVFKLYYPKFLAYMLIYDMPWLFNAAWRVIKSWLGPEAVPKIKFVTKADIQLYVKAEDLPPHMGGTDDFEYSYYPGMLSEPLYTDEVITHEKRVQFQEVEEYPPAGEGPDLEQFKYDINANAQDSLRQRVLAQNLINRRANINNNAVDRKPTVIPGRPTIAFIGNLLKVSPTDELNFQIRGAGDTFDVITLTNPLKNPVAFKVKTTSPEKFRVRPSSGILKPDKLEEVYVYLVPEQAGDVSKDKFLIMATEAQSDSQDPNQLFRDAPKEKIMQHKLKCSIGTQDLAQASYRTTSSELKALADPLVMKSSEVKIPDKQVEQLEKQNQFMQRQLYFLLALQLLTLLILILGFLSYSCLGEDFISHFFTLPFSICDDRCPRKC